MYPDGIEASIHDDGLHCWDLFSAHHGQTSAVLFFCAYLVAHGSCLNEFGGSAAHPLVGPRLFVADSSCSWHCVLRFSILWDLSLNTQYVFDQ